MPKQICDSQQAREDGPSLDERIAWLRRRRAALTQAMGSLTAYARCAGRESGFTCAGPGVIGRKRRDRWSGTVVTGHSG